MIPPDFIQQLLSRVDIVEVVDKYVKLKKAGQNYSACCPFHNEKTPSFSVSPSKQFYHCFGCGVSGTAITFLMEYSGMGFRDAVRELAEGVGLPLPQEANAAEAVLQAKEAVTLGDVMSAAMSFYRQTLKQSPQAITYLKGRGLSGEIAAKFALGFAPDEWQGLKHAVPDYTAEALKECGLVIDSEEGRRYDRFRNRIMFPILDQRGNVIAFGGRIIEAGEPKYLNSPETPLFEKGRELYGLYQARKSIRDSQIAIVVEGYMDVVALAQSGIENAVATLGTATTPTHVQKLLRIADNLVFCFDGDRAGRKAAWRALEQSLPEVLDGKDIRFLFLPEEDDPDTYVRRLGKEAFLDALKNAKPLSTFLFDELSAQVDLAAEEGRARLLALAKPLISQVAAPAMALMLRRRLAEMVGLGAAEIERLIPLATSAPTYAAGSGKPSGPHQHQARSLSQTRAATQNVALRKKDATLSPPLQLIARMLIKPRLAMRFDITTPEDDPSELGAACRVAVFIRDHDLETSQAQIVEHFRDTQDAAAIHRAISRPLLGEIDPQKIDLESEFDDTLARLREEALAAEKRAEINRRAREMGLD